MRWWRQRWARQCPTADPSQLNLHSVNKKLTWGRYPTSLHQVTTNLSAKRLLGKYIAHSISKRMPICVVIKRHYGDSNLRNLWWWPHLMLLSLNKCSRDHYLLWLIKSYVRQMCRHLSTPRTDIKTLFCSGKNVAAHLSAGVTLPWSFLFYGPIGVELRSASRLPVKVFVPYPIKKPEFKSQRGTPYSKAHSFSLLLSTQLQSSTSHQALEVACVRLTFCLVGSDN